MVISFLCKIFFTGPYIVSGKHGNAIFTPNTGTFDDNVIDIGEHQTDCLGKASNCPGGMTFSIWIKLDQQPHQYPTLLDSNNLVIHGYSVVDKFYITNDLRNETHKFEYKSVLSYNEWHLIAYTYTATAGFQLYMDGCKYPPRRISVFSVAIAPKSVTLGCRVERAYCSAVNFDDIRVWNEKKDEAFMWLLWRA